jgi:dihydroflavonol-4-reductase
MRALVTGASGFIGGNLARELVRQGYQVRALIRRGSNLGHLGQLKLETMEGDLLDENSLERALEGCSHLFHAAALYTFWSKNPQLVYDTNVRGTENILKAAGKKGLQKIVYTSSESVIGIDGGSTLGDERMQVSPGHVHGAYKKSKIMAEQVALRMHREGLPVVIVNPTTPVGPYDVKPTPTGRMVTDYLNGRMFACIRTGLNVVDVEDVAKGHILAMQKGRSGQRYLLGNRNMTLREIMTILEKISGIRAPRFYIPYALALGAGYVDEFVEGTVMGRYPRIPVSAVKASRHVRHFDCSKAVQELDMPQTPVEGAFERAVRWFRDNGYVHHDKGGGDGR